MDSSNKYIKKIAATGAAFPTNSPLGKFFDYDAKLAKSAIDSTTSVKFTAVGAMYNDPIICLEFNKAVYIFNPVIRPWLDSNDDSGIEWIPNALREEYNFRALPIIDLDTLELKWFLPKSEFKKEKETTDAS